MKTLKVMITALLVLTVLLASACAGPATPTTPVQSESTTVEPTVEATEPVKTEAVTEATTTVAATEPATTEEAAATEPAAEVGDKLQGPFIVTSCGQSPGAVMINMVAKQAGLTSVNDNGLTADAFAADGAKTLIITTGTSGKGMGAAGTDVDAEIARCVELIKVAREAGLTICCAHVEGLARRTDSADQASIDAIIELADVVLVIEESDDDGFFTDYTNEHNIPLLKVKDALAIGSVME